MNYLQRNFSRKTFMRNSIRTKPQPQKFQDEEEHIGESNKNSSSEAEPQIQVETLKDETFTIAIIGRPNVGKSTLFNRLMGKRLALVDKTPGLTRDRREGVTSMFNVPIRLVDTAGYEGTSR